MSIKRSKQSSTTAKRRWGEQQGSSTTKKEPDKSWQNDVAVHPESAFVPYALTSHFDKGSLIAHPSFGKGLVVNVDGARIEVLFETSVKKLGHAAG